MMSSKKKKKSLNTTPLVFKKCFGGELSYIELKTTLSLIAKSYLLQDNVPPWLIGKTGVCEEVDIWMQIS